MLTKKKIIESIKAMPENSFEDIDVLLERIVLLEKIEEAENENKVGTLKRLREEQGYIRNFMNNEILKELEVGK